MRSPEGYRIEKALWNGAETAVCAAVAERDGSEVVLKFYLDADSKVANHRAESERDALEHFRGTGVPRFAALTRDRDCPVLVREYVPGVSLLRHATARALALDEALQIGVQLSALLDRVHGACYLHHGIAADLIVFDATTCSTYLIDFDFVRKDDPRGNSAERRRSRNMTALQYLSPEQSGRMNRGVDARSDLYSLGAILYLLFTGRPVFESEDPLALLHAHMARVPTPPAELRTDLPEALSQLVLKLLAKEPDERYSSAAGVHAILIRCRRQLAAIGSIEPELILDASGSQKNLCFPAHLVARQRELEALQQAYERALAGELQVVHLYGDSGVGKSRLIEPLRQESARRGGHLACGKFDAYQDRAFSAVSAALNSLAEQMLMAGETALCEFRSALLSSLGKLLPAAVELVPELRFIVGDQPPTTDLGPAEALARSSLAIQRMLHALARRECPLALFIDDMQWSDPESRSLLSSVIPHCASDALLLICAFRTDERSSRARSAWTEELASRGVRVTELRVASLPLEATRDLLEQTLEPTAAGDLPGLAELLQERTGGNPLHLRQFLEHLHGQGLLRFRTGAGWDWELAAIETAPIPDGVVEFMTEKIRRLCIDTRVVLERASLVGDEFTIDLLCALEDLSSEAVEAALRELSDAGLIVRGPNAYRFAHDRIREAAQSGISADEARRLHYRMGRIQLERLGPEEVERRALQIVEHLNRGREHLDDELLRSALHLNHVAAKQSLAAGAAETAFGLLEVALELLGESLGESIWQSDRGFAVQLMLDAAESAHQSRRFDTALRLLEELDARAPSEFEAIQIALKRTQVYGVTESPEVTATYILRVLRRLGIRWPLHPSPFRARLALRLLRFRLGGAQAQQRFEPAKQVDLAWFAPIILLGQGGGVLIRHDTHLTVLATCLVLRRYLRHGYVARLAFSLASYSVWTQVVLGDSSGARELAGCALELNQSQPDPVYGPRCEMQIHAILMPFLMPRKLALEPIDRAIESLREVGDAEFAYYCSFLKTNYLALGGILVQAGCDLFHELVESVRRGGLRYPEPELCETAYQLLNRSTTPEELRRMAADFENWSKANTDSAQAYARTLWLMVLSVHGHFELAYEMSMPDHALLRTTPYVHVVDHTFYRGLAAADLATQAQSASRRSYIDIVRRCTQRMTRWAKGGPDFLHMQIFLQAELARLAQKPERALSEYSRAAKRAEDQEFLQHAALARERQCSVLWLNRRSVQAVGVLDQAIALYERWGARGKVRALKQRRRSLSL